ncbi:hypothetical protein [Pontibacter harenae]|uniref:hypothetical protein n=1 Tax=Pontibacter harenae TaxID=2894083 RepID=UPI001E482E5D|nr:hypothetical protein [Pontibacter harenae]MCC9168911.1 hypothetical protein [Pontibacter harenae]
MKEIPEIKLVPVPETDEAKKAVGYQWNDEAGTRHKLGGKPNRLSMEEYPTCKNCGEIMSFYAQIDSIGDDYDLADCCAIHVFVCFDCFTTESQLNQIL